MSVKWVVAVSRKEAVALAPYIGCKSKRAVLRDLRWVTGPPTLPVYARQYRIYRVELPAGAADEKPGGRKL